MDFDAPVFIDPPTFPKYAFANLSENPDDWVHDVTKLLYDKIPYVFQFPTKIHFERMDPQMGYGLGELRVGQEGTTVIPLIVEAFQLKPFDVFYSPSTGWKPLSQERLEELQFQPEMFGDPTSTDGLDQSIYTSTYPPHSGKYVYAANLRAVSILDRLNGAVAPEHKTRFVQTLEKNATVFAGFRAQHHMGLVRKVAQLQPRVKKDLASVLPVNTLQIEKVSSDQFLVSACSDMIYAPRETSINRKTLFQKFGGEVTEEVMNRGVYTTIMGRRPYKTVLVEEPDSEEPKPVSRAGKYQVVDLLRDTRVGWVFPNVVDFDMKSLEGKLFTDGNSYSIQSTIVGVPISTVNGIEGEDAPPLAELKPGATGIFLLRRAGKEPVCTLPFSIGSAIYDQGTHLRFEAFDFYGRPFVVEVAPGVTSIRKSTHQYNTYVVPNDVQFIDVGRDVVRVQDDPATAAGLRNADKLKAASGANVVEVSYDDRDVYSINGTGAKGLHGNTRDLGRNRARWHLVNLGMGAPEAEQALDRAKNDGHARIVGTKTLITQREKQAGVLREVTARLQKIGNINRDLIKEASVIDEESVVDKVLSVGFITPENMQIFIDAIPILEDALSRLAEILTAVRLGLKRIPESAVKRAMDGLDITIAALRSMSTLQDAAKPQTAVQ